MTLPHPPILAYRLFHAPLPIDDYWVWFALPLVIAIAVVYKTLKGHPPRRLPREAGLLVIQILVFLVAAALLLSLITWVW